MKTEFCHLFPEHFPPTVVTPPEESTLAITIWQKALREVVLVTAGMGSAVALGKATGTAFMDSFFTFGVG